MRPTTNDNPERDGDPIVREAAQHYRWAAEAEYALPEAPDRRGRRLVEARMAHHRNEADRLSRDLPEMTRRRLNTYYVRVR